MSAQRMVPLNRVHPKHRWQVQGLAVDAIPVSDMKERKACNHCGLITMPLAQICLECRDDVGFHRILFIAYPEGS